MVIKFLLTIKSEAYLEGFGVKLNFPLARPLTYLVKIYTWTLDFWMQLTTENIDVTSVKFYNVWSTVFHSNILLHVRRS